MSQYPRIVLSGVYVVWDLCGTLPVYARAGTVVDVVPGSKLELAYGGPSNLSGIVPVAQRGDGTCWSKSALSN